MHVWGLMPFACGQNEKMTAMCVCVWGGGGRQGRGGGWLGMEFDGKYVVCIEHVSMSMSNFY